MSNSTDDHSTRMNAMERVKLALAKSVLGNGFNVREDHVKILVEECEPSKEDSMRRYAKPLGQTIPFGQEPLASGRRLSLTDWWDEGVLRGSGSGETTLSRLQVVRVMRDQDGGAHFDDHLQDEVYLSVYFKGVGFFYKPSADSEESCPVEGALQATVTQMVHELMDILPGKTIAASMALAQASQKGPLITQLFEMD